MKLFNKANQDLTRLQAATEALSKAATPAEVARVALEMGMPALGANAGGLIALNQDTTEFELVQAAGVGQEVLDAWPLPADVSIPAVDALRSGEPVLFESGPARHARYPLLAKTEPASASGATADFPLIADGHPVGVLGFGFAGPHSFTRKQKAFMLALAAQCAQALERARLYEAERNAKEALDRRLEQLQALYDLTNVLGKTGSLHEMHQEAMDHLERALKTDRVAILLFDEEGVMRFSAWRGLSDGYRRVVEGHSPWAIDASDPKPVLMPDVAAEERLDEGLRQVILTEGIRAVAFIPVVYQGKLLGKFMLYYNEPHVFAGDEVELAQNLASQMAFASKRKRAEQEREEGRRRLQGLFDNTLDAILLADDDGRYVDANRAAEQLTGYPKTELLGLDVPALTPEEGRQDAADLFESFLEQGELSGEFRLRRKDGTVIDTEFHAVANFVPGLHLSVLHDVTERKGAEDELRESERRYRELVDGLGVAVYTTDAEGRLTHFNDAAVELWGRRPELGKDLWCGSWKLYRPDGRPLPHEECPLAVTVKENRPVRGAEIVAERPDGSRVSLVPYPTPLRDASGRLLGAVNVLVDITERKQAEELLEMRARQQAAVADLGQQALSGLGPQSLMENAAQVVAHTLEADFSKVLELLPGGDRLLLRAGVGWKEGYSGRFTVETSPDKTQAGYTLLCHEPVIVEDLESDTRFGGTALLHEHGVVSGLSVIIAGNKGVFGVLSAHTKSRRRFTKDDINFLQSVANVLAEAIERKKAESAIQYSEHRYRSLFENNYDAVMSFDADGRFTSANKACEEITGFSEEELRALPSFQPLVVADDLVRTMAAFAKAVRGEPANVDIGIMRKDGRRVEVSVTGLPIIIDGEVTGVFGIARDVTERRQAERMLALQSTLLQSTNEALIDGILVVSDEGRMISFNRRFVEMWGIPDEVVATRSDDAALQAVQEQLADPDEFLERVQYLYEHPDEESREEVELRDGRTFDRYSAPVRGADSTLYGRVWYFRDITERKRTEEALRESEARVRAIVETAADGIITIDDRGTIQSMNPAAEALFGYSSHEAAGRNVKLLMPSPYHEEHDGYISRYQETGERRIIGIGREVTGRRKDGTTFPMYLSVSELGLNGRRMFTGIVHDLTERKRSEERLSLQYEIARVLAESRTLGQAAAAALEVTCRTLGCQVGDLWTVDPGEGVLVCQEVWHRPGGEAPEFEAVSRQMAFPRGAGLPGRVWERGAPAWIEDVTKDPNFPRAPAAEQDGIHGAFGFPLLLGNEVLGVMEFFSSEIKEPDGDLLQTLSAIGRQIGQFIERQRAETAFREGEQRLRFAMDAGGMGAWEWNMLTNEVHWSESLEALHGIEPGTFAGTFEAYMADVHPDDSDYVVAQISGSIAAGMHDIEYRIVRPDGDVRWVSGKGQVVRDQAGEPVKMVGVCMDITERKTAEEAVLDSEERFSKAFHASPAALSITRAHDRRFIDVNESFLQMLGFERDEVIGQLVDDVGVWASTEDGDRLTEALNEQGEARNLEVTLRTKSGELREALGSVEIVVLAGEPCVLALFYDITERKRAEENERFLARASEELSESLDFITVLRRLADLAVPTIGDWAAVDMVEDDGSINRLVVTHADPAKAEIARKLEQWVPTNEAVERAVDGLRQGRAILSPTITDDGLRAAAANDEHFRLMQQLGYRSAMIVPLRTRDRLLGAITLVTAESGRRYGQADLALAQELARRAALAVENARLYREARETEAELRKANEAKDEFLGLVSHELRTPITIIYGGVQTLRAHADHLDEESQRQLTEDIEQEASRLRRIIEDLLVLARGETAQKQVLTEPVLLQRMVDKLVKNFRQRNGGRDVLVDFDDDLDPVAAEPVYLEQVLRNLLSNAEKYSPQNTPIELRATRNGGDELVVSVLDRGVGIEADEVDRVFERFYRTKDAARQARGVGMGLTVCRRLIEAQAGRIWARPREGGGLEVSFALPVYTDNGEE